MKCGGGVTRGEGTRRGSVKCVKEKTKNTPPRNEYEGNHSFAQYRHTQPQLSRQVPPFSSTLRCGARSAWQRRVHVPGDCIDLGVRKCLSGVRWPRQCEVGPEELSVGLHERWA